MNNLRTESERKALKLKRIRQTEWQAKDYLGDLVKDLNYGVYVNVVWFDPNGKATQRREYRDEKLIDPNKSNSLLCFNGLIPDPNTLWDSKFLIDTRQDELNRIIWIRYIRAHEEYEPHDPGDIVEYELEYYD